MSRLRIDIWSDIACPWCFVGKRRLEAALRAMGREDEVHVVWRAFELDTQAPRVRPTDVSYAARLAGKYGTSVAQAEGMIQRMVDVAAGDGLDFRFDIIRSGNTFDAHRLIHFAHETDPEGPLQDQVKERFLRGYMSEGEAIGEPDVLARLAADAGLDRAEAERVLGSDACAKEVRADEAEARARSISGVPYFVFDQRLAVSGAQSPETFRAVLGRIFKEREPTTELGEGAACGPDGC